MSLLSSNNNSSKGTRSVGIVFLLDVFLSVFSSIVILLFFRWQVKVIPDFELLAAAVLLTSFTGALIAGFVFKPYRIIIRYSSIRSLSKLFWGVLVKDALLSALLLSGIVSQPTLLRGIAFIVSDFVLTVFLLVLIRLIIVLLYDDLNDDVAFNIGRTDVMVYGTSDKAVAMTTRLHNSPTFNVVGFLSPDSSENGIVLMDCRVYSFSDIKHFASLKVRKGFSGIIFARDCDYEDEQERLVPMAIGCGVDIYTAPSISPEDVKLGQKKTLSDKIDMDFIPDGMTAFERQVKRIADLILSAVLIVFFSPLFAICAIAVKLYGGDGPVLFSQERIGRFGRPFTIYKFRTMCVDSEPNGAALYGGDDDPRLTKVGRFLRVHHLDELPQLFNVFRGDMAFIGYRPERKFYIDQIMKEDPRYAYLYQIRPGVTSYATLKNGYADSIPKMLRRLEFDLYYLRHRSAWFDIKILCQTFISIVFGKRF